MPIPQRKSPCAKWLEYNEIGSSALLPTKPICKSFSMTSFSREPGRASHDLSPSRLRRTPPAQVQGES